jgi:SAM-dependent methyltransferase
VNEEAIRDFWQAHPCGNNLLSRRDYAALEQFFTAYDAFRYELESHIPACLDDLNVAGLRLLEVGLGHGALWSGLDLTREAVNRVRARLTLRGLPFDDIRQGSITQAPFPNSSFDMAFSHGVLHHVPDILAAQREIRRILRPGGRLVIMLYAKYSLNYLVSIALVRRLGLIALYFTGARPGGVFGQHLENARRLGLWNYLRLANFVHANTDGPLNPYSKVYTRKDIERDFPDFAIDRAYKRFMHAPPLPVHRLPFERLLGWHLWAEMRVK